MKQTTRILIVEDEGIIAEHLRLILNALGVESIEHASHKESALSLIQSFNPELVLLDIRMKDELDGIEIGEVLNQKYNIPFIYITAHSDTAIVSRALDTKPAGYITKPFNQASVFASMKIALSQKEPKENNTLNIKDGFDLVKIEMDSILFVQSERNYIDIVCQSRKHSIRHSLEWFIQQVPEHKFMRVHRSFVINIGKVLKIAGSEVLVDQQPIPVSRKYMYELKNRVFVHS